MTLREAILKSLDELVQPSSCLDIANHITKHNYYDFSNVLSPQSSVHAYLSVRIRDSDTRFKKIKRNNNSLFYLTKNESIIENSEEPETTEAPIKTSKKSVKKVDYQERDLHKLLSSYLNSVGIFSKTIFHEESKNGLDNNQIWTHPDMVGVQFLKLQTKESQNLLKAINKIDTLKISSYELKKEINSDSELKKAFFQAVSNSSWANYGYLVAFEFGNNLLDELKRLNQSFGIGVIELNANPYLSKVLFQPVYRDLDFKTIDKLCKINDKFKEFITFAEKIMTADEKFLEAVEKELHGFCDQYFIDETEIEKYCLEKHIPIELNDSNLDN